MSQTPEQLKKEEVAKMQRQNPSVAPGKPTGASARIPLSVPQRKLEVPEIPGYYLRWFRGTPARLAQAQRAGFTFVAQEEVQLNSVVVGGDASHGNTDLGSRVSVVEGSEVDTAGQAVRLYLMKQKMEHYIEDAKLIQERNDGVAEALAGQYASGAIGGRAQGESNEDVQHRYVDRSRTKIPELFRKKVAR